MLATAARTLASAVAPSSASLRGLHLLPPIPLYRRLLRAHRRHLPREMRALGDKYVASEIRAHREEEKPAQQVRVYIFYFFFFFFLFFPQEGVINISSLSLSLPDAVACFCLSLGG